MDTEEFDTSDLIRMMYIDDLKHFRKKWRDTFEEVGYLKIPTSICNSMVAIERELESLAHFN